MSVGDHLRVTTEGMAYGPHAVARAEGKVIFVRGAGPGEEVEAVVREERPSFAYADVVEVVRPSPARRTPPCPYLPRCGGCPWQHLEYPAQLEAKRNIVREQLRRIGGLELPVAPVLPSPAEYGYRRRLKLRVHAGELGFYAGASHDLVPIDRCLLAEPAVNEAIPGARDLARAVETKTRRLEIIAHGPDEDGVVIAGEAQGAWRSSDERRCRAWLTANPQVRGLRLGGRGWRKSWGDTRIGFEPEPDLRLTARAQTFTQVNPGANRALVSRVLALAAPRPGLRILEVHAGAGNLSIPLARRGANVVAVEVDGRAAEDGRRNVAAQSGISCRVISERADRAIAGLAADGARFDVVVLDPPRSGAAELVAPLAELGARHLVYVSCDPATLARDLKRLGVVYRIDTVQPIDMFPHTYHVETVVGAEALRAANGKIVPLVTKN